MPIERTPRLPAPNRRGDTALLVCSAAAGLTPKCPLCYFALLGATGAAGTAAAAWMPIIMIGSLLLSVAALGVRARIERRYGAVMAAAVLAVVILAGRFLFHSTPIVFSGAAALFGVAVLNILIERPRWHKPLPH